MGRGSSLCWGAAGSGSMDIDALSKLVHFFSAKGHPIVVIFNYSTTFKCTCDDVQSAGEVLIPILKKNYKYECKVQDPDKPNLLSCIKYSGALSAAYMPFLQMAYIQKWPHKCQSWLNIRFSTEFYHNKWTQVDEYTMAMRNLHHKEWFN